MTGFVGKKKQSRVDWTLIAAASFLIIVGLFAVYSTSLSFLEEGAVEKEFYMQILWLAIGIVLFFLTLSINYTKYAEWALPLYGIGLLALLATFIFPPVSGSRWINLGFIAIQPSEPMKLCVIIALARFLNMLGDSIRDVRNFFIVFIILLPPMGLVALQPDFGTSLSFLPICFAMLFVSGAQIRHILSLFALGLLGGGIPMVAAYYKETGDTSGWLVNILSNNALLIDIAILIGIITLVSLIIWLISRKKNFLNFSSALIVILLGLIIATSLNSYLKPYQRKRIVAFFDAEKDPWGSGYNIIQSKIAIGSGGFSGKGFTQGPQNALSFLPENKTDFIYSTLGEEWGFIGSFFLLLAYFIFLYRAIMIAKNAKDTLGSLIAIGIAAMFTFHIFVNIGMATGIMPVTGLPLPFVSYGGSNLLTNIVAVALLVNIESRRYIN
jgi:rod shape determining protein RodA